MTVYLFLDFFWIRLFCVNILFQYFILALKYKTSKTVFCVVVLQTLLKTSNTGCANQWNGEAVLHTFCAKPADRLDSRRRQKRLLDQPKEKEKE